MILLKSVSKEYILSKSEKIQVLHSLDLNINRGEFVAIMGPSGSGKSTLMNIIGLLDKPSLGEYYLDGIRVDNLKESKLATIRGKKIGFIFQNYSLLPRITAIQQIGVILSYQGIYGKQAKQIGMKYLEKVGLADKFMNKPNELSGGQSQRVAIARALSVQPDILLADEPTGALDSKTGDEILNLFQTLNKEGKTVIMITHDYNVASYANRIIKIKDGKILFD